MRTATLILALCLLAVAAVPAIAQANRYSWAPAVPAGTGQWALFLDGQHVGTYDPDTGIYWPRDPQTEEWGHVAGVNDIPEDAGMPPGVVANYGVRRSKFSSKERYSLNGSEVSRETVVERLLQTDEPIGGKQIPDDGSLPRITVAGSKDRIAPVLAALAKWKDRYVISDYRPDAWQLTRQGFLTSSDPTIYVQDASGTVLRRLDGYSGDQAALDKVLEECVDLASRRPKPYNPHNDEGWQRRVLPFLSGGKGTLILVGLAAALLIVPFALRKHK